MSKQGLVFLIFILFGLLFFQNLMNIFQYKRLMKQYKEINSRSHYTSVGNRRRWGRRRTALVGFDQTGVVTEVWILNGILVTSKFHKIEDFNGLTCDELLKSLKMKNKDHQTIAEAANFMKLRLENKDSDEEYFKNNPRGIAINKETKQEENEN